MEDIITQQKSPLEGHIFFNDPFRTILFNVSYPKEKISELKDIIIKHNLIVKPEHHITLIGYDTGDLIQEKEKSNADVWNTIKLRAESHNWKPILTDTFRLIEQDFPEEEKKGVKIPSHKRRTLIQDISLEEFPEFYQELQKIIDTDILKVPFPHVTIASWSDYEPYMTRGIGLYSRNDVETYTTQIGSIDELRNNAIAK